MTINQKSIQISRVEYLGTMSCRRFTACYNDCGESQKLCRTDDNPGGEPMEGYIKGVQPSSLQSVYEKAEKCINEKNAGYLEILLKTDFIYPGKISSYRGADQTDYDVYRVRPNVEALFTDVNDKFLVLIDLLLKADDALLYDAFSNSLVRTDLDDPELFQWNNDIKSRIEEKLGNIMKYADTLHHQKSKKAKTKAHHAYELASALSNRVYLRAEESKEDEKHQFENLKFKLQIAQELHAQDKTLNEHRYPGMSLFGKTKTERKISKADASIGLPVHKH